MSNDQSARRILPQSSQMSSFSFQPQQVQQQRETQKNYVFVDEHNRHKRLKVMRACEGCRRRKIKCDAATTNTWPCSACIRLRLHCVRPNGQYDSEGYETSPSATDFPDAGQLQDGFQPVPMPPQHPNMMGSSSKPTPAMYAAQSGFPDNSNMYQAVSSYPDSSGAHQDLPYTAVPPSMPMMDPSGQYATSQQYHGSSQQHSSKANSPHDSQAQDDPYGQQDISDVLGSLKLNDRGTAPYLRNKASFRQEEEDPAIEDADDFDTLPPMIRVPGHKVRIPPALMPDDETAMHYFDLYFANVHPFVPVLNKSMFLQQWHTKRETISPLILEAIFAVAGRLADEPAQGQQWLAMLTSHADAFMDVPRLSTLQALLIFLKAREAAPKRGYFYRSWMSIVQCVQMGKDLGLDEHLADHEAGEDCDSNPVECQLKSRIWQTIYICEIMVGSPQGRYDLVVDPESVDFSVPRPLPAGDESEYHVSRNFTYFARVVHIVGKMSACLAKLKKKKKKEWALDKEFTQLGPSLRSWYNELPGDLTLTFPPDGSAPWLPSAFLGNLHSYYHLAVIILHRPQLAALDPNGADDQYKKLMVTCYSSAKALCRCQEAVVNSFGMTGLQCMQRGFSFSVYCGLSCIVLHLVAMTSPDPELNTDARDFFTRHMRVMENIMTVWHMADLQKQIDAVREAFSADIRKPFVLKPSFPYGSPHPSHSSASPPAVPGSGGGGYKTTVGSRSGTMEHQQLDTQNLQQHQAQVSYTSHPITPPISAGPVDTKSDSPIVQSLGMMPGHQGGPPGQGMNQAMSLENAPQWNPQRIFDQWNTSFGTTQMPSPSSTGSAPAISSLNVSPPSGQPEAPSLQDIQNAHVGMPMSQQQHMAQAQAQAQAQYSAAPVPNFITPAMWQESVASVYEGGMKRAWDYEGGPIMKRTR